jgi:hypothetical protein
MFICRRYVSRWQDRQQLTTAILQESKTSHLWQQLLLALTPSVVLNYTSHRVSCKVWEAEDEGCVMSPVEVELKNMFNQLPDITGPPLTSYWATTFHTPHLNLVIQVGSVVCTPQKVSKVGVQATPSSNEVMPPMHLLCILPKVELNQHVTRQN